MRKMKLFSIVSMAVISFALVSCNKAGTDTSAAAKADTIKVKLAQVEVKDIDQSMEFTASVEPEIKNNIAPSAPGRIRHIFVKVGSQVSKGERLAQMDVANLSNSETQIENYKRNYKRIAELFAVGGASQQDLDNAKLQLDVAQTNLKNLSENTYLLSPISGVITAKNYDEGDMYSGQQPILTVMQINPVKLKVDVSESYYSNIKLGMPVSVKVDVFGDEEFSGKVSLIYPTIDENTRTFTVEVRLANNNGRIKPGMFARVDMNFGSMKHVVVPDLSVIKQVGSGSRYVYVYNSNNTVSMKEVTLGRRVDDKLELLSGLNGDEQVVVAGLSKVVDGCHVQVIK